MTETRTTWSLRLPTGVSLQDLDGCILENGENSLVVNGVSYKLIPDTSFPLSVLLPVETENDDTEDEQSNSSSEEDEPEESSRKRKRNKETKNAKNTGKKLEAHPTDGYAMVPKTIDASDAMLKTTNIDTASDFLLRKAYRHVPQISGLKRRWMPPGVTWKPTEVKLLGDDTDKPHHQPFGDVWNNKEESHSHTPTKDETRRTTKKEKKSSVKSSVKKSSSKKAKKESKERKSSKRSSSSSKNRNT